MKNLLFFLAITLSGVKLNGQKLFSSNEGIYGSLLSFEHFQNTSNGINTIINVIESSMKDGSKTTYVKFSCLQTKVGLKEIGNEFLVKVFPNPSSDCLSLDISNHEGVVYLEILTMSGQRVMNTKLLAPLEAIQVNNLPSGLYLLKFTLGYGRSVTERVVVAR